MHITTLWTLLTLLVLSCKAEKTQAAPSNEASPAKQAAPVDPTGIALPDTVKYWRFAERVKESYENWYKHDTTLYKRINRWAPKYHDLKEGDYNIPALQGTPRLTFAMKDPFLPLSKRKRRHGIWSVDIHGNNLRRLIHQDTLHKVLGGDPRALLSRTQDMRYLVLSQNLNIVLWDFKTNTYDTLYYGDRAGKARFTKDEKYIFYFANFEVRRYHMATGKDESWNFRNVNGLFFRNDKYIIGLKKGGLGKYDAKCLEGKKFTAKQACVYEGSIDVWKNRLNARPGRKPSEKRTNNARFGYKGDLDFGMSFDGKYAFFYDLIEKDAFMMIDIEKGYTGQEERIPGSRGIVGSVDTNVVYLQSNPIYSYNRQTKISTPVFGSFGRAVSLMTYSVNGKGL